MQNATDFFQAPTNPDQHSAPRIADEAEACAAVLVACLRSSDLYGITENAAFFTTIQSRNIFRGRDANALVASAEQYLEQAGSPAALIDSAMGPIREQTRLPLFYHCLDCILADGIVTPQEHKIFLYLKTKFKVADETAWTALDVLVAKNKL
ncbi:MAG: hypothetical protein ABMA02_00835 [Saprospiraceae bacterium]